MTLYPLAFPKGVKYLCELCREIAYLQCKDCHVTYYCCKEHQESDWQAVHEKICHRLPVLRRPFPANLYKGEHIRREAEILAEKTWMIQFTKQIAHTHLYAGQESLAMPAAMQCLNFTMSVHGPDSLHLVPCYILLAEACIGLGRLLQAKEYMARAKWKVLKDPDAPAALKSQLHRCEGRLCSADGKTEEALRELGEDIYQSSLAYGPDDIHTSGGYFYMADVFFRQGKRLVADSLYRQVTHSWYTHLHRIFKYRTWPPPLPRGVGPGVLEDSVPVVSGLDEVQKPEALRVLTTIFELRKKQTRCPHREMMIICLTLGILHFLLDNLDQAQELGRKAVALGRRDPECKHSYNAIHFLTVCETFK